jgi:hypothetical protein
MGPTGCPANRFVPDQRGIRTTHYFMAFIALQNGNVLCPDFDGFPAADIEIKLLRSSKSPKPSLSAFGTGLAVSGRLI